MRILLVEDDKNLARQISRALRLENYAVDVAHDGEEGHYLGEVEEYDAVVLDLGLPVVHGIDVLSRWRSQKRSVPVLILTARDAWNEKVKGFEAGADDYLTKPFVMAELVARLRALIRRSSGHAAPKLTCGEIELDETTGRVSVSGRTIKLTSYEDRLLSYLMHHPGKICTRFEILQHVYEQDLDPDSNTLEVFVARLRKKLGVKYITTIRGRGYRLDPPDAAD